MSFIIKGTPVCNGIAQGIAFVISHELKLPVPRRELADQEVPLDVERFLESLRLAERDLQSFEANIRERLGSSQADIFGSHLLMLNDPDLRDRVLTLIRGQRVNAEWAVVEVMEQYTHVFMGVEDPYLRERAADVRDVGRRLLSILLQQHTEDIWEVPDGAIVVADELLPSATAYLEAQRIRGLVTEHGGPNSHAAILARALGCPAITGLVQASSRIKTGDYLILDGLAGTLFVNPRSDVIHEYRKLETSLEADKESLSQLIDEPARTRDGADITLRANIGKLADAQAVVLYRAQGIGLFRTEFCFAIRDQFPTEEEQYRVYSGVSELVKPGQVVFRLLDIGADKQLPYFPLHETRNPSLGQRGVRLLLKYPQITRTQLRAMLRVSAHHNLSILVPMVTDTEDAIRIRQIMNSVQDELRSAGIPFDPGIQMGAMLEVPAAALMARQMARYFDFFSLGTNDLVQYLNAADREDEEMTSYFNPLHPAVSQLIAQVVRVARQTARELSICGEMAGEPRLIPLLLGLGLRTFSVSPARLLEVKRAVRTVSLSDAESLAEQVLTADSCEHVAALVDAAGATSETVD